MRIIRETLIDSCRVTFFSWNNRYIIKLEEGLFEQTFKIDQLELAGEAELLALVDAEFVQHAMQRFSQMGQSLHDAKARL